MRHLLVLLGIFLALNALVAAQQKTALREDIEINHDTILLSDFLPASASENLRSTSQQIELGRAPEPGTLRVFAGAQIAAAAQSLGDTLSVPDRVTVRRTTWLISREAIWKAISKFLAQHGWSGGQITGQPELSWPAIAAGDERPILEATRATRDLHGAAWEISVRCIDHTLCGKFLVRMAGAKLASRNAAVFTASPPVEGISRTSPTSRKVRPAILAKSGSPASLIVVGKGFRITLPVICLQPGTLGQRIRVRDPAGTRILIAEVVSAETLRAVPDLK